MRSPRRPLALTVQAAVVLGVLLLTRRLTATWGTFEDEHEEPLAGDEILPEAVVATRGITIDATPEEVWPWIAQLGQGRGGFYSYDALENLLGLDIHSADRIEERWQDVGVGDPVHLAKEMAMGVAAVEPGQHLVLAEGLPGASVRGVAASPVSPGRYEAMFTWSFVLRRHRDGRTRLLVRERYARRPVAARVMAEIVQPASFVMSARMLRGIRDRAQGARHPGRSR